MISMKESVKYHHKDTYHSRFNSPLACKKTYIVSPKHNIYTLTATCPDTDTDWALSRQSFEVTVYHMDMYNIIYLYDIYILLHVIIYLLLSKNTFFQRVRCWIQYWFLHLCSRGSLLFSRAWSNSFALDMSVASRGSSGGLVNNSGGGGGSKTKEISMKKIGVKVLITNRNIWK